MTEPQRVTLPDPVMKSIKTITHDATLNSYERLVGTLILTYGWALYEREQQIDGTLFQLPDAQWHEVCGYLTNGVPGDAIDDVNLGLDFMNKGPSSYSEGEQLGTEQESWDTTELQRDFRVLGFQAPYVVVVRKADGVKGSLEIVDHAPRRYFNWQAD